MVNEAMQDAGTHTPLGHWTTLAVAAARIVENLQTGRTRPNKAEEGNSDDTNTLFPIELTVTFFGHSDV